MSGKDAEDYAEDYTKPELRERLKEEIKASDRGADEGRWSARKSQLLTQEYEKQGGDYRHKGKRTKSQRELEQWGEQDWQTKEGGSRARDPHGTSRYLPEVAWRLLSPSEREATDAKKHGDPLQHVANTEAAKEARKAADLLDMKADEAAKAVRNMDSRSGLDRARKAEERHGKGRKTVLRAIAKRLQDVKT